MILKKSVTTVILCVAWIYSAFGSSYSKVYVNSGNPGSYQYVRYGAPAVAYGPTIAQLSAPPVQSAVPYPQAASFVPPCVSPCVPQQTVTQVANAPIVAYPAPRGRLVVAGDAPPNYEYSYVVYDDNTGDQKAARELSDGGVVRGRYSFLQPDGYVREVQYTADDATGFNAVVNYLPAAGAKTVEVKESKPCADMKPEALKQEVAQKKDTGEKASEPTTESIASIEAAMQFFSIDPSEITSKEDLDRGSSEEQQTKAPTTTARTGSETTTESIASIEAAMQFLSFDSTEITSNENLDRGSSEEQQTKTPTTQAGTSSETTTESMASIVAAMQFLSFDSTEITSNENLDRGSSEEQQTKTPTTQAGTGSETTTESIASIEAAMQFFSIDSTEETSMKDLDRGSSEERQTVAPVTQAKTPVQENAVPAVVQSVPAPPSVPAIITNTPLGFVSYDQLLKCIQKIQIADQRANSPLTYILLPSNFKPC